MLDLSAMRGLDHRPAPDRLGSAGLTAGEYQIAAGTTRPRDWFGDTGSVGIGGSPWAEVSASSFRKHGMTIDALLGAEFVTADGEFLHVDCRRRAQTCSGPSAAAVATSAS